MNPHLAEQFVVVEGACAVTASDADLREFRANLAVVKRYRLSFLTRLRHIAGRPLSIPLAFSYALRGVSRYGPEVKKQYNIGLFEQFRYLSSDHFSYRILPESFY